MVVHNNILAGASGATGVSGDTYQISKSLRFNSSDSAYLKKNFSSAGDTTTWTLSFWIKRATLGGTKNIFMSYNGSSIAEADYANIYFDTSDRLVVAYAYAAYKTTDRKFRDDSAWYHIVVRLETGNSTASDRVQIYVNGVKETSFASTHDPELNESLAWNKAHDHRLGSELNQFYNDCYLAEVHFVDGQALAASDFGEFDDNNVWQPKKFTHGTAKHLGDWVGDTTGTPYSAPTGSSKAFDGDDSTGAAPATSTAFEFTPSTPITGISKVRIRAYRDPSQSDDDGLQLNGTEIGSNWTAGAAISEVEFTVNNLTSLRWETNSISHWYKVHKIEIYYDGAYHTLVTGDINSFHLDFSDNSSNAALGTDSSGNSNTWTVNNLTASISNPSYDSTHGSNITSTEAAKIFDSDDSTYGVATGDFVGFAYGGSSVKMKVENTSSGQVSFYIQPNVSNNSANSGTWGSQSAGTVSNNQWYIPANTTATATFTFPATWDGDGRIYTSGNASSLRFYSMDASTEALAGIDSLIDTPTDITADSGNNPGNYCTWNPLDKVDVTLSNGNLDCSIPGTSDDWVRGTIAVTSGKYYWEVTLNSGVHGMIGIADPHYTGTVSYTQGVLFYYVSSGSIYGDVGRTGGASSYGSGLVAGDILGVALDMDNGNIKFYKNGVAFTGNANTSTLAGKTITPALGEGGGAMDTSTNFGQRGSFAYTPPTGYNALCTTNLPDPAIADGSTAMDVLTWNGNDTQRDITGLSYSPDLVWIKQRSGNALHSLQDTVRGATKNLVPNGNQSEGTETGYLNAFLSNGFSIGTSSVVNDGSSTYVGWAWDAGTSTVSNTDGSITSSVRANPSAGFSIVSYNGDNNAGDTVGHGLSAKPGWILIKNRDDAFTWYVYHSAVGATKYIRLDTSNAETTGSGAFNNTEPTSSVFSLGQDNAVNDGNKDYIAYCWAPVEGYSAFGGPYSGTGSASTGAFQYCGFKPRLLMIKRTDSSTSGNWIMLDSARSPHNVVNDPIYANDSAAEYADKHDIVDFLSNGFKIKAGGNDGNNSGGSFIWAAWAESPFKTARAR